MFVVGMELNTQHVRERIRGVDDQLGASKFLSWRCSFIPVSVACAGQHFFQCICFVYRRGNEHNCLSGAGTNPVDRGCHSHIWAASPLPARLIRTAGTATLIIAIVKSSIGSPLITIFLAVLFAVVMILLIGHG